MGETAMPCGCAPDRWGEDLGAPRSYFVAWFIRAGFEPRRAGGIAPLLFPNTHGWVRDNFGLLAAPRHGSNPARA